MHNIEWLEGVPVIATVCDTEGTIIYMNKASIEAFHSDGGESLLGSNLLDCHPEPSRSKLKAMMDTQTPNIYTIEKGGKKMLIYQVPWTRSGEYAGFIELELVLPSEMPHFVRDKAGQEGLNVEKV